MNPLVLNANAGVKNMRCAQEITSQGAQTSTWDTWAAAAIVAWARPKAVQETEHVPEMP